MTGGGTPLARRVADHLREGPVHTLAIARDVLGLSGHPGAASAAVFALLGGDPRFRVSAAGEWTFDDASGARMLDDLHYAVVDVETTGGGVSKGHRITEFAVVEVVGREIVDQWSTLVNPGRTIPPIVERITGISDGLVHDAPFFEHIAPEVADRLEGRIFVAHNVDFDRSFVHSELVAALGEAPALPPLCTVRLARALLPKLKRRNLDELTRYFGIRIQDRHRALGDAVATAQALLRLLDEARGQGIVDLETLNRLLRRRGRRTNRRTGAAGPGSGADSDTASDTDGEE